MSPDIVLMATALLLSISIHESAHAYVASMHGDQTARRKGRVSINPMNHIDPVGTILVPALLMMMGGVPFGWARPVPVNPGNLRNPRRDRALVSAAGPGSNIGLAIISMLLCVLLAPLLNDQTMPFGVGLGKLLIYSMVINIILAVFNLIPLGPLDGSGILEYFLNRRTVRWLRENQMLVTAILFFLIFSGFFHPIIRMFRVLSLRVQMEMINLLWGPRVANDILQLLG